MTRDEIKQRLHTELEPYLRQKGIDPRKAFRCLNPAHEDVHPSMHYSGQYHNVHCFACGKTYDIFDLIGIDHGLDGFTAQFGKACDLYGLTPAGKKGKPTAKQKAPALRVQVPSDAPAKVAKPAPPIREETQSPPPSPLADYLRAAQARVGQTDYPALRGLSQAIVERFGLGYDPAFSRGTPTPWQALIIPTGPESYTARNTDPGADKHSRIRKQGRTPIFNADILQAEGPPVFVVEGEIDALSLYEAGGEAVALGSTANVQRFLQLVAAAPPRRTLLIAMDADEGGQRAADALTEGLGALDIRHHRVVLSADAKDANDALLADREGLRAVVESLKGLEEDAEEQARAAYCRSRVSTYFDDFIDGISARVDTPYIPTGFPTLDRHLDGGLFEGLYIVGAISSLGKTTFVLQMADQIARGGQDVLLVSLEMSRYELMAKSLSRQTVQLAVDQKIDTNFAKTARGITTASRWASYSLIDRQLLRDAIDAYRPHGDTLYIHEGIGDIGADRVRELVEQHRRYTGNTPVVIIDYLQILAPHSDRATDKQNTDKAVLELKRISRDFKAAVVCVSSFNRANYREAVTMEAFKESGAIEYSSDVLIGLQLRGAGKRDFDPTAEKEKDPRRIELVVLKNRNGPTGKKVEFQYYPRFNCFMEREAGKKDEE
ncbi:toprim domain-containing protein [Eubacteriales bacterium OttesenSCG-928-A19]|nr:toprim domain-containing protein [Eubacteriales bacterium OttesenSCG-928-A19]